jgi:hypothetical protein
MRCPRVMQDFTSAEIETGETSIFVRAAGSGPPLLLLQGFPQTHVMWRGVDELSPVLTRIRIQTTVAPGREWLAESFFSDLLKQRSGGNLIVHGPVALAVDERAAMSFARASATTRRSFDRVPAAARAG